MLFVYCQDAGNSYRICIEVYGNEREKYMNFMAERKGFEPSMSCPIHEFQSCAFDHSATSLSLFYMQICPILLKWVF